MSKAVLQWSKLNIGIEDQAKDGDKPEIVKIKKSESGNLLVEFEDGPVMNFNNILLAANGASFNIPQQRLNIPGMAGEVTGLNECTLGEARCDGFYDSQKNELSFSFDGTIKIAQNGEEYNVPMAMGYYKLSKEK